MKNRARIQENNLILKRCLENMELKEIPLKKIR